MTDMHIHARKKIDPEEFEQHMVTREGQRDSLLDYHIVERVIGSREGDEEDEYYVKCECEYFHRCRGYLTLHREGIILRQLYMGSGVFSERTRTRRN